MAANSAIKPSRGCTYIGMRLFAIMFGLLLAWLLLEIFLRVGFTLLPPDALNCLCRAAAGLII